MSIYPRRGRVLYLFQTFTVHQYLQMSVEYEHVLRKKLLLGWSKTAYGYAKGCFRPCQKQPFVEDMFVRYTATCKCLYFKLLGTSTGGRFIKPLVRTSLGMMVGSYLICCVFPRSGLSALSIDGMARMSR